MNRVEAMSLLKQLTASKLIDPSWVSMESKKNVYKIKIKATQKTHELEQFFSSHKLLLEEENGYWLISKP